MPLQTLRDGTRIHYAESGEGLPTLVPCVASSIPYERSFGEQLKRDHRFIFMEARGTARSEGSMDIALDRIADDLEDLREQLGLDRIAVLGHSRNGFVAARYAQKYPAALSHAVVIGTPVSFKHAMPDDYWEAHANEERRQVARENQQKLESEAVDTGTPEGLIRWFDLESHRLWYDPHYRMTHLWEPSVIKAEVADLTLEAWADFDLRETFLDTTVPVLAAFGRYDFHAPPIDLLEDVPTVSVEVFERSGHFPYVEEESAFADRYREWRQAAGVAAPSTA